MEKRQENRREQTSQKSSGNNNSRNNTKKNKRRGSKKAVNNTSQAGGPGGAIECNDTRQQQPQMSSSKNYPPGVAPATTTAAQPEYGNIFWQQSPMQQQLLTTPNGQRLFTAVSDPSVCGYSPMPMTYTMEPVSLPPMYQLYQPIARPNYRNYRGRARRNHAQSVSSSMGAKMPPSFSPMNGYSSLQENNLSYSMSIGYQNGDYASLPPAANIENGTGVQELSSEHRRYSDPGLGPAQIPLPSQSDDSESLESGSSVTTVGRNNKLILSLIEQVTALKDSNSQLFKELHQTKSELETVKMELNRLKQSNFADYQPGMLSDIVREMREAAKVREESLISKVKSMMNEKQPSLVADASLTELDELKNQLARIKDEKTETEIRLAKVEQELATLKSNANHEGQEIVALEEETLALRRELQEARESRTVAENHASKLEKLVGILRKKMNVASGEDTSADTRGLVASGLLRPAAASSPVNNEAFSNSTDPRSTAGSTSSDDSESRSNTSSRNNSIDNGNVSLTSISGNSSGLSGPVTDL